MNARPFEVQDITLRFGGVTRPSGGCAPEPHRRPARWRSLGTTGHATSEAIA
jgi:hypothetical protein